MGVSQGNVAGNRSRVSRGRVRAASTNVARRDAAASVEKVWMTRGFPVHRPTTACGFSQKSWTNRLATNVHAVFVSRFA
jgi:hypothetical protein